MGNSAWQIFIALAPTAGLLFIFYLVIKGILEGDRRERLAHAQWERERAARSGDGAEQVDRPDRSDRSDASGRSDEQRR